MPARKKRGEPTIYQLKVTLKRLRPPIWRRIQVSGDTNLGQLHQILQIVMGWENYHLHQFTIGATDYGQPHSEDDFELKDETNVECKQLLRREKFKFFYIYDFGDNWEHEILVEKILAPDPQVQYPVCLKGKRACPPEDCGGAWGYAQLLEKLEQPETPEYEEMEDWLGQPIDPESFDLNEVNQQLSYLR